MVVWWNVSLFNPWKMMHRVSLSRDSGTSQNSAFPGHSSILRELQAATPSRRDCTHCLFQRGGAVEGALVLTLKTPCLCPFWCILHPISSLKVLKFLDTSETGHFLNLQLQDLWVQRREKGSGVHRGRAWNEPLPSSMLLSRSSNQYGCTLQFLKRSWKCDLKI